MSFSKEKSSRHESLKIEIDDECHPIKNVVIIGTGLMGTGLAQVANESGFHITVVGRSQQKCTLSLAKIKSGLEKSAKRRFPTKTEKQDEYIGNALNRIEFYSSIYEANLSDADLVIEAVVENLEVKQKLFAALEPKVSDRCLLVTNTSSLPLNDISTKLNRPNNFAGLHFFCPVLAMKLVEVVRAGDTSDTAHLALCRFCERIGKTPVKCRDSQGFIVNRLLLPYLADAIRLAESGDAEICDIDMAMRLGTGYPMGPFELMDYIGLDTVKFALEGCHKRFPEDLRFVKCSTLEKLVSAGKLGRKSGDGFYRYENK